LCFPDSFFKDGSSVWSNFSIFCCQKLGYIKPIGFFDIFSYFFGKAIGKTKLINISPKKTIEGLVGGIIVSSLFAIIFSYYFEILINIQLFIYIVLIIFSSLSGDLVESYFKRKNNLKNSSNIIPGHGGVFDRFDSFLFSIIVYSIFVSF